jgi:formylglycine-generating enzyme required for sulfatase activity
VKDESHPEDVTSMRAPCCAPDAQHEAPAGPTVAITAGTEAQPAEDMVLIGKGSFLMGSDDRWAYPADGEGPVRESPTDRPSPRCSGRTEQLRLLALELLV